MRKAILLVVTLCFCLGTTVVFADQYLVVKDRAGTCKIQVFKADKGAIIAGPYTSKKEAAKALRVKCPEAAKKAGQKKSGKK